MARESLSNAVQRWHGDVVKRLTGYRSLKSFIRELRACKSAAAERTLIAKELATVHDGLRSSDTSNSKNPLVIDWRWQSVAKLLYCAMYAPDMIDATAFAQIDIIAMCSDGPRIRDRRLGYLAASQLLDSAQKTLTLLTNTIKRDLERPANEAVIGLALQALTALGGAAMVQELAPSVALLYGNRQLSEDVRKKAACCACSIIAVDADLAELFISSVTEILTAPIPPVRKFGIRPAGFPGRQAEEDQRLQPPVHHHGLLLATCHLLEAMLQSGCPLGHRIFPALVKLLADLRAPFDGSDSECAVGETRDPFLQCQLLRCIARFPPELMLSEQLVEVCEQILKDTVLTSYASVAVALEVCSAFAEARQSAAVEFVVRLLESPDENIRYVDASSNVCSLAGTVFLLQAESLHKDLIEGSLAQVVALLSDPSMAIRRHACTICLGLVQSALSTSPQIVESLFSELLAYLVTCKTTEDSTSPEAIKLATASLQLHSVSPQWLANFWSRLAAFIDDSEVFSQLLLQFVRVCEARGWEKAAGRALAENPASPRILVAYAAARWSVAVKDGGLMECPEDDVRCLYLIARAMQPKLSLPKPCGPESERFHKLVSILVADNPETLRSEFAIERQELPWVNAWGSRESACVEYRRVNASVVEVRSRKVRRLEFKPRVAVLDEEKSGGWHQQRISSEGPISVQIHDAQDVPIGIFEIPK